MCFLLFGIFETNSHMRAIAKWFISRSSTTAKGRHLALLAFIALCIFYGQIAIYHQWPVLQNLYSCCLFGLCTAFILFYFGGYIAQCARRTGRHLLHYFLQRRTIHIYPRPCLGVKYRHQPLPATGRMNTLIWFPNYGNTIAGVLFHFFVHDCWLKAQIMQYQVEYQYTTKSLPRLYTST